MRYIPHSDDEIKHMLDSLGVDSVAELFKKIPNSLRLDRSLKIAPGQSELELLNDMEILSEENLNNWHLGCFLGAGAYSHFIPSAVDAIASRSEFYTAYTPYQPEISQGTLQTIFEWQTMMCGLTGCEVTNASMYDGASAAAEAALMAIRITGRKRVGLSRGLHPNYRQVVETYLSGLDVEIFLIDLDKGTTSSIEICDKNTACVLIQQPNFLGGIEPLEEIAITLHKSGTLLVACVNEALSLAFLKAPGSLGADIVCGDAQSFGVPINFGGPHLGFLSTRKEHVRQIPGRLVGQTVDGRGLRGFVLTLSTREQHIRRERATSNICTNQGLCLLMATVYLALHGKEGLRELAQRNYQLARYARERVKESDRLSLKFEGPSFNEFVIETQESVEEVTERCLAEFVLPGLSLSEYYPELGSCLLVCVTELSDKQGIDRWLALLEGRNDK